VTEFKVGDAVFGGPTTWFGAHAEYICVRERAPIALKPEGMSFDEAAAVCDGASQALGTLRVADAREGRRIVIYGASGSLGTAAVQLAKHFGAHVTAVCNTKNVELVRSLGAEDVIDYTREDLTKRGPVFDVVIDAVGKYAFHWGKRALKPGGMYVETDFGPYKLETLVMWIASRWVGSRRLTFGSGRRSKADVLYMKELIDAGAYRPVIDRVYPLEQVAEAHRRVESWHKVGNVVLTL
jgi:NADPH:quinone reductase-like Zn-dependent oxidoreductase